MKEKTRQSYSLRWYTFRVDYWSTFRLLFTIMSMLKEYNFSMNQRNKTINGEEEINEGEEWTTVIDIDTGQPKRIKKVKSI